MFDFCYSRGFTSYRFVLVMYSIGFNVLNVHILFSGFTFSICSIKSNQFWYTIDRYKIMNFYKSNFSNYLSTVKGIMTSGLQTFYIVKGTWQWGGFLGFLHKTVRHWSLTLCFEPFRFWLQIRGDIHNRKTTLRLAESGSQQDCLYVDTIFSNPLNKSMVIVHYLPWLLFCQIDF
jgi:hypothetical protein